MRILIVFALALLALATWQLTRTPPGATQASVVPRAMLGGGPIDTGGFLLYTPPGASQPGRLAGAYWRERERDSQGETVRENVRRWTLRDINGLDATKVTKFVPSDPMLSESGGSYVLTRVTTGDTLGHTLQAVEDIAGVRPLDDKSDVYFSFWGYRGEYDELPEPLSSAARD